MSVASETLVPANSEPQAAGERVLEKTWWRRHNATVWLWAGLVGVTVLGAFLRYWRLGYQAYWTDEAYTVNRIRGNFLFLLNQLADPGSPQGFPPGWYALLRLWRIVGERWMPIAETYQPGYLRMLPAFFGTMTVPAMYLLGRQFTDRRGALLVAMLTAVNPFLIYYARDIKMYAALWFFVALNMGLFLQWLSSPRNLLWFPLFVLSGVFMAMMHPLGWAMLVLQAIFVLTRRRPRGWDVPLWAIGAAIISILPTYWYIEYQKFSAVDGRLSGQVNHGMGWIQDYTDMSWRTVAGLPTAHILGYLWPVYPPDARLNDWFKLGGADFTQHLSTRSWAWMAQWQANAAWGLFAVMVLGLLPWRRSWVWIQRWRGKEMGERPAVVRPVGYWWWVGLWIVVPMVAFALTWIPKDSPWFYWVWHGRDQNPLWEPRYLGIIVPAWLLWLAASLRRLPLWPVRAAAIVAVTGVCGYSSLSNHVFYRNPPMNRAAEILEKYMDPKDRFSTGVAIPEVAFPDPAENTATTMARHVVPLTMEDTLYMPYVKTSTGNRDPSFWPAGLDTEIEVQTWLRTAVANNSRIKTVVVTDRYGDITAASDMLSDESVGKILGPRWTLVDKELYTWHYEWRFYIFHTWRTRVYKLTSTLPSGAVK